MNQVALKPDGKLTAGSYPIADHPLRVLGHQLQLSQTCSLRSIFFLFENFTVFTQLGDVYPLLKTQYEQCPDSGCLWPDYDRLQFSKTVEMTGYPGIPRLDIYHSLEGIGSEANQEEIRHLPLNVLLDIPLVLGPLKHRVFGDRMEAMEFETVYTLFEFIDGVTWALSFHGTPTECLTSGHS